MPPPDHTDDDDADEYELSSNDKSMALLAHVLEFFFGFIGPAVILFTSDKSPFARRHAKESLNYQITLVFHSVIILVVGALIGWGVYVATEKQHYGLLAAGAALILLGLVMVVFEIALIIKAATAANRGQEFRYPITIRLV
jgi:uncharacterized protein